MFTLFLVCFLVGVGVSSLSLLGGHFHGLHGFHHFHHVRGDGGVIGHLFNFAAITMFLTWFGAAGLLLEEMTKLAALMIILAACGAGGVGAATINRIIATLRAHERPLEPISLVGTIGKLTIPIRKDGTGEVVYTVEGKRRCSGARSDDGREINRDAEVVITKYDKGIAYVCEFDKLAVFVKESTC
jgi:hypothetical protein